MEKKKRIVNRYYTCIIYKEDNNFKKYFNNILSNYEEVTYIEHDRDINEETRGNKKTTCTRIIQSRRKCEAFIKRGKRNRDRRKLLTRLQQKSYVTILNTPKQPGENTIQSKRGTRRIKTSPCKNSFKKRTGRKQI